MEFTYYRILMPIWMYRFWIMVTVFLKKNQTWELVLDDAEDFTAVVVADLPFGGLVTNILIKHVSIFYFTCEEIMKTL